MWRTDILASASASDHFKIFARLWGVLGVNGRYELLEYHERRQTAHATAIEGEETKIIVRHD
jgi:hypothetical protein